MYRIPSGKEFKDKGCAIRYFLAQEKTVDEIISLTGLPDKTVKIGCRAFKDVSIEEIDIETGMLKSVIEKRQAKEISKTAEVVEMKSKNLSAMDAAEKTSETKSEVKKVAKKKAAKKVAKKK